MNFRHLFVYMLILTNLPSIGASRKSTDLVQAACHRMVRRRVLAIVRGAIETVERQTSSSFNRSWEFVDYVLDNLLRDSELVRQGALEELARIALDPKDQDRKCMTEEQANLVIVRLHLRGLLDSLKQNKKFAGLVQTACHRAWRGLIFHTLQTIKEGPASAQSFTFTESADLANNLLYLLQDPAVPWENRELVIKGTLEELAQIALNPKDPDRRRMSETQADLVIEKLHLHGRLGSFGQHKKSAALVQAACRRTVRRRVVDAIEQAADVTRFDSPTKPVHFVEKLLRLLNHPAGYESEDGKLIKLISRSALEELVQITLDPKDWDQKYMTEARADLVIETLHRRGLLDSPPPPAPSMSQSNLSPCTYYEEKLPPPWANYETELWSLLNKWGNACADSRVGEPALVLAEYVITLARCASFPQAPTPVQPRQSADLVNMIVAIVFDHGQNRQGWETRGGTHVVDPIDESIIMALLKIAKDPQNPMLSEEERKLLYSEIAQKQSLPSIVEPNHFVSHDFVEHRNGPQDFLQHVPSDNWYSSASSSTDPPTGSSEGAQGPSGSRREVSNPSTPTASSRASASQSTEDNRLSAVQPPAPNTHDFVQHPPSDRRCDQAGSSTSHKTSSSEGKKRPALKPIPAPKTYDFVQHPPSNMSSAPASSSIDHETSSSGANLPEISDSLEASNSLEAYEDEACGLIEGHSVTSGQDRRRVAAMRAKEVIAAARCAYFPGGTPPKAPRKSDAVVSMIMRILLFNGVEELHLKVGDTNVNIKPFGEETIEAIISIAKDPTDPALSSVEKRKLLSKILSELVCTAKRQGDAAFGAGLDEES